jgi:hypothetical protein
MKFVKGFEACGAEELADRINIYAKNEKVEIVQINYFCAENAFHRDRALVVFSKGE